MKRLVINKPSRNSLTNLSLEVATKVCRRLYEYEDTGLTPEEIQELKADRDYWEHEAKKWCAKLGEIRIMAEGGMDYVTKDNL